MGHSVAIVGCTGAVGLEMMSILEQRKFPLSKLRLMASSRSKGKQLKFRGKKAIFALLDMRAGHFSYTKGIPDVLDSVPPIGSFMGMMMEGVQKIDESKES